MQTLLSPETFEFLARFFLAGWIFLSARSWVLKGDRPKPNEVLFEAITLSLLNQLVALATLPLVASLLGDVRGQILLVAEVFLQPLVLALLISGIGLWLANRDGLPDVLRRFAAPSPERIAKSFEYAFDSLSHPAFVILTFPENRTVYGYFGPSSLADRAHKDGGILIERIYVIGNEGTWTQVGGSAWVDLADLKSIEFVGSEG